ncbi:hypothetical protein CHELA1G11_13865 [Hyphomicrobiales bacterium]|nr:hypothetical protein CHELA1G11_13865 [Hyphomicrobiales bacterium]
MESRTGWVGEGAPHGRAAFSAGKFRRRQIGRKNKYLNIPTEQNRTDVILNIGSTDKSIRCEF